MTIDSLRRAAEPASDAPAPPPDARADLEKLRAEVSSALRLPPTIGLVPGELARVLRATEEQRDAALAGLCPQGYAVVTLAQADERGLLHLERDRFITANAELGLLCVRQGYALRVLRGAAEALTRAVGERDRAEAAAAHDDTGGQALARTVAQTAVQGAFTALHEALDESEEEAKAAETAHQELVAERDRLQRACDEGLPREVIRCPNCNEQHLEWFRHDAPGIDGRKRPHHTHRCYHCEHVWDSGRWSFGAERPTGIAAERDDARRRLAALILAVTDRAEALRRVPAATLRAYLEEHGWNLAGRQNTLDGSPKPEHWHAPAGRSPDYVGRLHVILCEGATTAWQSVVTAAEVGGHAPEAVLAELLLRAEGGERGGAEAAPSAPAEKGGA